MIVIKVGGSQGIDYQHICQEIAERTQAGEQIILIHGGSHQTNEIATTLGHPPQFITSPSGYTSRLTDHRTLQIFEMVYCGLVNKEIVERLQAHGVNAIGLSGLDGGLWRGPRKKAVRAVENGRKRIIRNNYTGRVEQVNTTLLQTLLADGYTPVLTPPALSHDGEAINVDGDRAAAATAAALGANQLLILSNIPGLLRHFPNEDSLIPSLTPDELTAATQTIAQGRMRIKLLGAQEALNGGVQHVILGDARHPNPIHNALNGAGTHIHLAPIVQTPRRGVSHLQPTTSLQHGQTA